MNEVIDLRQEQSSFQSQEDDNTLFSSNLGHETGNTACIEVPIPQTAVTAATLQWSTTQSVSDHDTNTESKEKAANRSQSRKSSLRWKKSYDTLKEIRGNVIQSNKLSQGKLALHSNEKIQNRRRSTTTRTLAHQRWQKAIWYAMQEARRRREEDAPQPEEFSGQSTQNNRGGPKRLPGGSRKGAKLPDALHTASLNLFHISVVICAVLSIYLVDFYVIFTENADRDIVVFAVSSVCFALLVADWLFSVARCPGFLRSSNCWTQVIDNAALMLVY